jgi:hypothetical protein
MFSRWMRKTIDNYREKYNRLLEVFQCIYHNDTTWTRIAIRFDLVLLHDQYCRHYQSNSTWSLSTIHLSIGESNVRYYSSTVRTYDVQLSIAAADFYMVFHDMQNRQIHRKGSRYRPSSSIITDVVDQRWLGSVESCCSWLCAKYPDTNDPMKHNDVFFHEINSEETLCLNTHAHTLGFLSSSFENDVTLIGLIILRIV